MAYKRHMDDKLVREKLIGKGEVVELGQSSQRGKYSHIRGDCCL